MRNFAVVVWGILYCTIASAGVGDIDKREYVDWSQPPYDRFVYFEPSQYSTCTAQYVGRDIILTARHCVDDGGIRIGNKYKIILHNGAETWVTLEKHGSTKNEDWALLRVSDSHFYTDNYFDVSATEQYISIENTGFGYMRILTDEEIKTIKQIYIQEQERHTNNKYVPFTDIMQDITEKLNRAGIDELTDFACTDFSKDKCWRYKLKSDKTCRISAYVDYDEKISLASMRDTYNGKYLYKVPTTCDNWGGNSGGAYFANNTIYGICSGGIDSWSDAKNTDWAATPTFFYTAVQEMRKTSPAQSDLQQTTTPPISPPIVEDDIIIPEQELYVPDENFSNLDTSINVSLMDFPTIESNDISMPQNVEANIQSDFSAQENVLAEMDSELLSDMVDIENMSDEEFLHFLGRAVEYDVLQRNLERAKAREQSLANRMLGAAAIGAAGIGGMMLASGLAEQQADANAERDMAAYLATFRCDYGAGITITGGETNIQLPSANVLLPIYNEYIALAADLKIRKEALGMAPGIESEIIADAATSGLYDNVATGITDGAYTSLSRALSDPTGADAVAWSAQRADTQSQLKTGGIVGGVGVVGGAVGNVLINHVFDDADNVDTNINNKQGI